MHRWTDGDAATVHVCLSEAFQTCLNRSLLQHLKTVYEVCCPLEFQPIYSESDWQTNQAVLLACQSGDFLTATSIANASQPRPSTRVDEISASLRAAILADDISHVRKLYRREDYIHTGATLDLALREGSDKVAAFIASVLTRRPTAIFKILSSRRLRAADLFISEYSHLKEALHNSRSKGDYTGLQDWLYHRQCHDVCSTFPCNLLAHDAQRLQLLLRVLSYCALHRRDTELLDWLCKQGLALGGLCVDADEEIYNVIFSPYSREKHLDRPQTGTFVHLPSLLEITARQGDLGMLQHFISATSAQSYSRALLQAVKFNASTVIDELLRCQEHNTMSLKRTQYGSAALRVAIRRHDHSLVRKLARVTDIHGIECVEEDEGVLDWLDPLGEAILQDDSDAVEILLTHGGDSNAVIAFQGLHKHAPRSSTNSVISRVTALLVAIDLGRRSMIELLLRYGATIDRVLDMGLLRTPLQRAAAIGDFDIVKYLIEKGATIDTVPAYGGGTALQLAAMSGHVGIARLLIENGADVNHPPAKGPGRTAFEAAAEWCHPDMMYLLVQHGAKLDQEVIEESEEGFGTESDSDSEDQRIHVRWRTVQTTRTQYERAIEFAEGREQFASKRIVQNLWDKYQDHQAYSLLDIEA